MIQETVSAILDAEAQAAEITAQASEEAKTIVANAENEAEKLRASTVSAVKEERKKVALSAREEGDAKYEEIMLAGKSEAKRLEERVDITRASDFIKEKVLSGYVNR